MSRFMLLFSAALMFTQPVGAQSLLGLSWQTALGGSSVDLAHSLVAINGGYLVLGEALSTNGHIVGNHGLQDLWLIFLDEGGALQWQRCYGGSDADRGFGVCEMSAGGCTIVGETQSNDGDVSGNHGNRDAWVVRLDDEGDIIWQHALGGTSSDVAFAVAESPDGGLFVTGYCRSSDGDVIGHQGPSTYADYWTLRLDAAGDLVWQNTIGGSLSEEAYGLCPTLDGGVLVAGESYSSDGAVVGAHGMKDAWVCKLGPDGVLGWSAAIGGTQFDTAFGILETSDGGALVVGETESSDGDVSGNHGGFDAWVVRLSGSGGVLWQRAYGGSSNDRFVAIAPAGLGNYLVAGYSYSQNGNVSGNNGGQDSWLLLLDASGNILAESCFGGSLYDRAEAVIKSPAGGYVFAGASYSADGDATLNQGLSDLWVVRIDDYTGISRFDGPVVRISPNPANDFVRVSLPGIGAARVSILDVFGRPVHDAWVGGPDASIALGHIPSGMYSMRVETQGVRLVRALIVE